MILPQSFPVTAAKKSMRPRLKRWTHHAISPMSCFEMVTHSPSSGCEGHTRLSVAGSCWLTAITVGLEVKEDGRTHAKHCYTIMSSWSQARESRQRVPLSGVRFTREQSAGLSTSSRTKRRLALFIS